VVDRIARPIDALTEKLAAEKSARGCCVRPFKTSVISLIVAWLIAVLDAGAASCAANN
jgi:hypothetical protein